MIRIRRDINLIPPELLEEASRAQLELEELPEADRKEFIKQKAHIWQAFNCYLAQMSYGKCWYSESSDPQSFFDVDHYRPKLEARRSDTDVDRPGYVWLTFSWENFRYAATCSNRRSENIETGVIDGKGIWFPLLEGSEKASFDNRTANEKPVLLDPVKQEDVDLIEVKSDGKMGPSRLAVGSAIYRVKRSCELYGLNLPRIKDARVKIIRDVTDMLDVLNKTLENANDVDTPVKIADNQPIQKICSLLTKMTMPMSPYSKAARMALIHAGWPELCANPECA